MDEEIHKLFGLLREALWGTPLEGGITPKEAGMLIALAEKQAISGLIIDALIKKDVRMEQMTFLEAFGYLEQIKQENQRMNRGVAAFARLMADTGTEYAVVKGQTLAALYPEPLVRMSGDIDFLIQDYQYVAKVLNEQWGIELPKQMVEKEIAFTHGDVLYELHTYLIDFGSNKHKRYWEQVLVESKPVKIKIDKEEVMVLEPTLNVVYVFLHLFFHFVKEGIGLRHLCDWAVMMHHYAEEIDKKRLTEVLQKVGLLKAFLAFSTILVDNLGMKGLPLPLSEEDRKFQESILKEIFRSGNFGQEKRKTSKKGLRYKMETMSFILSNCCRYYSLAPKEIIMMLYRRVIVNLKLMKPSILSLRNSYNGRV